MRLRITSIILLFVYLSLWLKPLYPFLEFKINKEYIIKVLCIERDKKVNTCQGQCHLNNEIKKNTNQDENQKNTVPGQNLENEIFFFTHSQVKLHPPESTTKSYCFYINNYIYILTKEHFHPPEIA